MINAMINSNYLIFIVRYLSKNTYTEFVMSDNHLFPSPDLSSIYRKSINRSKKKIREKRQNLHMDKKKIAKR